MLASNMAKPRNATVNIRISAYYGIMQVLPLVILQPELSTMPG